MNNPAIRTKKLRLKKVTRTKRNINQATRNRHRHRKVRISTTVRVTKKDTKPQATTMSITRTNTRRTRVFTTMSMNRHSKKNTTERIASMPTAKLHTKRVNPQMQLMSKRIVLKKVFLLMVINMAYHEDMIASMVLTNIISTTNLLRNMRTNHLRIRITNAIFTCL